LVSVRVRSTRVTTSRWRTALDVGTSLGENSTLAVSLGVGQDASRIEPTGSRDPNVIPAAASREAPMVRTLAFALMSILLAGCGTSNTSGAAETTGGAGAGGAQTGTGGASAASGAASAGSAGVSTAVGGAGAGSGGASTGAGSAGGSSSCGSQTCGATQYCVNPCCGGNAPACMVKPDGGTCPAGAHQGCSNGVQSLSMYLYLRPGELAALDWADVHMDHGYVHMHQAFNLEKDEIKPTKTGITRKVPIRPELRPLLETMKAEVGGKGRVVQNTHENKIAPHGVPPTEDLAETLRDHLTRAKIKRADLHDARPGTKRITFYDLRATGIT
jgi:hypothetical protein